MNSKIVVPGQYIVPTYKLENDQPIRYIPGRGTVVNQIQDPDSKKYLPVICATIVGSTYITKELNLELKLESESEPKEVDENSNSAEHKVKAVTLGDKIDLDETTSTYVVHVVAKGDPLPSNGVGAFDPVSTSINLPKENDIVLVRITRISQKQAWCEILAMENKHGHFQKNILADSGLGSNGATSHASLPAGGGSQHNFNIQSVASNTSNAQIYDIGENFRGIIRSQDIRSTERDRVVVGECFKPGDIVRAQILSLGDGQNYYLSTAKNNLGVVFAKSEGGAGSLMYPIDWQNMLDVDTGIVEKRKNANPFESI